MKEILLERFTSRLEQTKLATKDHIADFADFVKKTYFDEKLTNNEKQLLEKKKQIIQRLKRI